ncbi:hypothetical protein BpHYR1_048278 [Brachionus plicatilis]|uniref:Uncharacterized protein n=1 Tax=Brachionus plicatilis TaxID=10195 RepID=A0A3M7QCW8_BRAPC|nr:hypothetical protein BpHYR1_048278 [Brachionus plicatilis]
MKHFILYLAFCIFIQSIFTYPIENQLNKRFFGLSDDGPQVDEPEPDWANFKEIKIDTKEVEMNPSDLYSKIEDCIKKCMKEVNSDKSYRDNCVAKMCDIY